MLLAPVLARYVYVIVMAPRGTLSQVFLALAYPEAEIQEIQSLSSINSYSSTIEYSS